jgi:hypothetical protein
MLFYLDSSADELSSCLDEGRLAAVASDLARARRNGDHLIVISRSTAEWIKDNVDLSNRDKAILTQIAQEFTQTGNLRNTARCYVRISTEASASVTIRESVISMPVRYITQHQLLERPILLVENRESDGEFYEFILHNHCDLHTCPYVSYDIYHGGGADLPKVFSRLVAERKVICSVIDGDRSSPLSSETKRRRIQRIKEEAGWPLAFALSPPCREVENMLPMTLVFGLSSGFRNASNSVLLKIQEQEVARRHSANEYYWLFFDVKGGLSLTKLSGLAPLERNWIEEKLALAGFDATKRNLSGYGDNVMRQLFEGNNRAKELRRMTRQQSWRVCFSVFVEELIWPLAASPRVIT